MCETKVSRRGVYKDLTISPYEYHTPYGDFYKFSSQKKLDIYSRDVEKEIERIKKALARNGVNELIPQEITQFVYRCTFRALYHRVEGKKDGKETK